MTFQYLPANGLHHVTVGVADMAPVEALWIGRFGLEQVASAHGPDPELARLWGIAPELIAEQRLLRTPGAAAGYLHFVRFSRPAEPVRHGAGAADVGPKNLDVNCEGLRARQAALLEAGYRFRSAVAEYEVGGVHALEVQMPAHDETNVVLIEILSRGFEVAFSPAGFAALTSFVVIVPDTRSEAGFFQRTFGFRDIMHHRITGPGIEAAVGLPPGAALDMRLLGREHDLFGRLELIQYEGATGEDRFSRAVPPACGTLHCGIAVPSLARAVDRARAAGARVSERGNCRTLFGDGPMALVESPAGLRIELFQPSA